MKSISIHYINVKALLAFIVLYINIQYKLAKCGFLMKKYNLDYDDDIKEKIIINVMDYYQRLNYEIKPKIFQTIIIKFSYTVINNVETK